MSKKIDKKLHIKKILTYFFYGSFLTIVFISLVESVTYPGIFLNKTKISLNNLVQILSAICLLSYILLTFLNHVFKNPKKIFLLSFLIILITSLLTIIESITYSNFVFSKFHINHKALQTLSTFLTLFLLLFIITKINFKKIFLKKTKILIIILLFLTPILTYFSWSQHLSNNNIVESETRFLSSTGKKFTIFENEPKKNAFNDQLTWFFRPNNNYSQIKIFFNLITISFSTLFIVIAILFFINWLQNKKTSRIGTSLLLFYFGGIAYLFLIIYICVTMFSIGELKTFVGRYLITYVLALTMFSLYLFLTNIKNRKLNLISILYLIILFLLINIHNLTKLKPANKKLYLYRKNQEFTYQKILNNFDKNNKPTFHTINGEGAVGYRYFLAPYSVITPIWQEWDVFMLQNSSFKTATHVYLPSASDVIQKWSNPQIEKMFKNKNNVINNGLYKIIYISEDKSSFQLELINIDQ